MLIIPAVFLIFVCFDIVFQLNFFLLSLTPNPPIYSSLVSFYYDKYDKQYQLRGRKHLFDLHYQVIAHQKENRKETLKMQKSLLTAAY